MVKRIVWWGLTLACAALILGFSLQSVERSLQLSGALTDIVLEQDAEYQQLSDSEKIAQNYKVQDQLRNIAHTVVFACLGFCTSMLARTYTEKRWWMFSLPATMVFAILDESVQFLQHTGRSFQLSDIGRDWLGVGIGTAIVFGIVWVMKEKRKHGISSTGS